MPRAEALIDPIFPSDGEAPAIRFIDRAIRSGDGCPQLVAKDGQAIPIPESVYAVLASVIHLMAEGKAIHLVPVNHELTSQEAADLLNVSRPFLIKLLEADEIPYLKVGTHRRIRFHDLLDYKHRRDRERLEALDDLARISQSEGLY